jgi:hypothetical protein
MSSCGGQFTIELNTSPFPFSPVESPTPTEGRDLQESRPKWGESLSGLKHFWQVKHFSAPKNHLPITTLHRPWGHFETGLLLYDPGLPCACELFDEMLRTNENFGFFVAVF